MKEKYRLLLKLSVFLLFIFTSNFIFAQNQTIKITGSNLTLKAIFEQIEKQTELSIGYDESTININQRIRGEVKNTILKKILEEVLEGTNNTAEFTGKFILLKSIDVPKKTTPVSPQKNKTEVRGNITDINGEPLIGVTVMLKGEASVGTISDINGNYSISVSDRYDELTYSYVGYLPKNEIVGERKVINIVLAEDIGQLEEVVVVGYGTQKKETLVGSVSNIQVASLEKMASPSVSNTLGGQLPGIVSRQSVGEPGYDQATVYIRGLGSWTNREPLVLVDGIERDMNSLNTEEIESISILKDASATAIYGVRGANGVILITTKQGKVGKPVISLRTETAMLTAQRLPSYINSSQYAELVNEGRRNMGKPDKYSDYDLGMFESGNDPYLYPNVDWVNEIMKKHTWQNITNLNISGGTENVRYFANVGYTMKDGLYKVDNMNDYNTNAKMDRYNYRSRVDINLAKNLVIDLGVSGVIQMGNYPTLAQNDIYASVSRTPPLAFPKQNPDGSAGGIMSFLGSNPWATLTQSGYKTNNQTTLQATFGAKWDLSDLVTKGLSLSGRFAYDYYNSVWANRTKTFAIRQYLGKDEAGEDIYNDLRQESPLNLSSVGHGTNRAVYMEAAVNYDRTFGMHTISSMLLYNQRDYVNLSATSSIYGLPYRRQGIAGRATYNYGNRYLAEFNFGYNGSEQFPKGDRFGFFPSLSLGWIVSNENFWNIDFVDNFKIRASHGLVGNDVSSGNRRFLYLTTMNKDGTDYRFGESWQNSITEGQMGVENVTWETAEKTNLGIDFMLFRSLSIQVDAFYENRKGILITRQSVPDILGISSLPQGNLGRTKNRGIEGMIEYKKMFSNKVFLSLRGNFTYARNEVLEDDTPTPKYAYQSTTGQPIDQPFGLIAIGFFEDEDDIANSPTQTFSSVVYPGDIKYFDKNGDGVIDNYDEVAIGYTRMPEIMFGFGGTVGYKGFDVSVFFTGATRTSFFLEGAAIWPSYDGESSYNILKEYYNNRWTAETASTAKYPLITDAKSENNYRRSTQYMRDGSYLRLKNAEIGYTLDQKISRKIRAEKLRFFINGTDLFVWDYVKIVDPEANDGAGTYGAGSYPRSSSVNFGLQINF